MPEVYLCIPSARDETDSSVHLWRDKGYGIALFRDVGASQSYADILLTGEYPGYAVAVNALVKTVFNTVPRCQWVVVAGDDIRPDPDHSPELIASECTEHFSGTFGCMQSVGDRWGARGRAYIDFVAGSPWMGREFCRRVNQGKGPLWQGNDQWDGYFHMGEDEELQAVATKLGIFWQRPDLTHYHDHWGRSANQNMPEFLTRANSAYEWRKYKALFQSRQAAGFPGSDPIA